VTTHSADARNSIAADVVLADIDADAGPGTLELQTAGGVEVATLTLSDPAGVVVGPTLTFNPLTADSSATGGIVAIFVIKSNTGTVVLSGTVGLVGSATDIWVSATTIDAGKNVSIGPLIYNAPP
jgi:hypothetical protein